MPRKIVIEVFRFDELSNRAKETARDAFREHNLDYEWWESTYEDAANIGLKLTGFDLGRGDSADGKFTRSAIDVAKAIVKDHGEGCETYKDAVAYIDARQEILKRGKDVDDEQFLALEDLDEKFLKTMLGDYLDILRKEEEYLQSNESIDELLAEHEFYKDGRLAREH
jgi:hypothetical protein